MNAPIITFSPDADEYSFARVIGNGLVGSVVQVWTKDGGLEGEGMVNSTDSEGLLISEVDDAWNPTGEIKDFSWNVIVKVVYL